MIDDNLKSVRRRIATCCERSARSQDEVKLIAVTKEASTGQIEEILSLGVKDIGENRIQDAAVKYETIGKRAFWHMIGHLQTNKSKDAVRIFSLIHSVDSVRLAEAIDKEASKIGKVQDILAQVNVSGEASKFGIKPEDADGFANSIRALKNIRFVGLMTIAPESDDPESSRPYFKALRELRDRLNTLRAKQDALRVLSMGMTGDFEVAIEEGATMLRVGRAIFYDK